MRKARARRRVLKAFAVCGRSGFVMRSNDSDYLPIALYTCDECDVFCHAIAGDQWHLLYGKLCHSFFSQYNCGPFDPLGFNPHSRLSRNRNKLYATVGDLIEAVRAAYPL